MYVQQRRAYRQNKPPTKGQGQEEAIIGVFDTEPLLRTVAIAAQVLMQTIAPTGTRRQTTPLFTFHDTAEEPRVTMKVILL